LEPELNILTATVKNAADGDTNARAALYRQFSKAMFNICFRMLGNRENAEDILQEAFIIAFNKLHQLKDELSFGGWLKRIVVSECIRFNKKGFKWNELSEHYEERSDDNDASWMHNLSFESINSEIKQLPDGCRQVFNLYVVEDYSHKEISEILKISESTSKSQYHRARQLLKERLLKQQVLHG
jgi:RNA polymerase sigma-70 factor (ECF subfamily)